MNIPLLVLAYAYIAVLVTTYILTDLSLAYRLAMDCQSRRVTLVAVVAGALWLPLLVAFLAGLAWHVLLECGRGFEDLLNGPNFPGGDSI